MPLLVFFAVLTTFAAAALLTLEFAQWLATKLPW